MPQLFGGRAPVEMLDIPMEDEADPFVGQTRETSGHRK